MDLALIQNKANKNKTFFESIRYIESPELKTISLFVTSPSINSRYIQNLI